MFEKITTAAMKIKIAVYSYIKRMKPGRLFAKSFFNFQDNKTDQEKEKVIFGGA